MAPWNQPSPVPAGYDWRSLLSRDGDALFDHYRHVLEKLGNEKGLLGLIFGKSQNKFQDPAKLRRLIMDLINRENFSPIIAAEIVEDLEAALEQFWAIAQDLGEAEEAA